MVQLKDITSCEAPNLFFSYTSVVPWQVSIQHDCCVLTQILLGVGFKGSMLLGLLILLEFKCRILLRV